jgi:hypothetical protein
MSKRDTQQQDFHRIALHYAGIILLNPFLRFRIKKNIIGKMIYSIHGFSDV